MQRFMLLFPFFMLTAFNAYGQLRIPGLSDPFRGVNNNKIMQIKGPEERFKAAVGEGQLPGGKFDPRNKATKPAVDQAIADKPNTANHDYELTPVRRAELAQLSTGEICLSISVLVFATLIMGMQTYLILKERIDGILFFRIAGISLVICSGLFLIVAGYTQDQIGPMMGLLGTIAGYLLGKSDMIGKAEETASGNKSKRKSPAAKVKDEEV